MEGLKAAIEKDVIHTEKTALVVIDLQKGIVGREATPYSATQVIQNASKLANAFTEKGAFVVLVRVSTVDGKDMLKPSLDSTRTALQLQEGWDNLVPEISNIKNSHIIGYNQIFIEDAMTASTKEEHDYVCKYIFPRIGKIRTSEELILALG